MGTYLLVAYACIVGHIYPGRLLTSNSANIIKCIHEMHKTCVLANILLWERLLVAGLQNSNFYSLIFIWMNYLPETTDDVPISCVSNAQ